MPNGPTKNRRILTKEPHTPPDSAPEGRSGAVPDLPPISPDLLSDLFPTPLGRDHLSRALRYVDLNPVRASMVERAVEYEWSSARAHVMGRGPAGLLDVNEWRRLCPLEDWAGVLEESAAPDEGWSARSRDAARCGKPLGNKDFGGDLESKIGADLEIRRPGRSANRQPAPAATRAAHGS